MKPKILNRSVIMGAVIYGVLSVIFGTMTFIVFLGTYMTINGRTSPFDAVATYCVPFWAIASFVTGLLVARLSTRSAPAAEFKVRLLFAMLHGGIAVALGVSFVTLFAADMMFGNVGYPNHWQHFFELVVVVLGLILLGALGGGLYTLVRGNRGMPSIVEH